MDQEEKPRSQKISKEMLEALKAGLDKKPGSSSPKNNSANGSGHQGQPPPAYPPFPTAPPGFQAGFPGFQPPPFDEKFMEQIRKQDMWQQPPMMMGPPEYGGQIPQGFRPDTKNVQPLESRRIQMGRYEDSSEQKPAYRPGKQSPRKEHPVYPTTPSYERMPPRPSTSNFSPPRSRTPIHSHQFVQQDSYSSNRCRQCGGLLRGRQCPRCRPQTSKSRQFQGFRATPERRRDNYPQYQTQTHHQPLYQPQYQPQYQAQYRTQTARNSRPSKFNYTRDHFDKPNNYGYVYGNSSRSRLPPAEDYMTARYSRMRSKSPQRGTGGGFIEHTMRNSLSRSRFWQDRRQWTNMPT